MQGDTVELKKCSICGSGNKVITHHLSYNPEITTIVCWNCEKAMHALAKISQEYWDIIIKASPCQKWG
ncbi:MAG: hypothetical protein Q8J60_08710 [Thiobacillus sp.]|nr:hypothetical protein [Thiobacillus sp.]